jgi:hypothetical protein
MVVATRGPKSEMSAYALNRSATPRDITIAGFRPNAKLYALTWNADGKGTVALRDAMKTGGDGAVTLKVPAGALIAVSTIEPKK